MKITKDNLEKLRITNRLMIQEALRRGWNVEYLPLTDTLVHEERGSGIVHCRKNTREIIFSSNRTILGPFFGYLASENKWLTYNLLRDNKVPTPETVLAKTGEKDLAPYIGRSDSALVVKPIDTNHGNGITIGVLDEKNLHVAIDFASTFSKMTSVILQKMVHGEEYRFLVLNKKVIAVAHRQPPFVVGDGEKTVRRLLAELNLDKRRRTGHSAALTRINEKDVEHDFGMEIMEKVPEFGEKVILLKTSNLSRGGFAEDFTDRASEELKRIAVRAAESCHLELAGIDIMTEDIENGAEKNSSVIEVNFAPGLRMHEFPSIGTSQPVVKKIFHELEKRATSTKNRRQILNEIGRFSDVRLSDDRKIPARIDTGARTTAIWASEICEEDGTLTWQWFAKGSKFWTGEIISSEKFERNYVMSSNGHRQIRYKIPVTMKIQGRKIKTYATLADRSHAAFPILVGCNTLSGKFVVNVQKCPKELSEVYNSWYNKSGLKKGAR